LKWIQNPANAKIANPDNKPCKKSGNTRKHDGDQSANEQRARHDSRYNMDIDEIARLFVGLRHFVFFVLAAPASSSQAAPSADYFAAAGGVAAGGVAGEGVAAEGVAAGEGFFWAARSFSTAVLQRALKLALCLSMHASVFWIFGADELQRRHASAAHFARVSAFQAKLGVERAKTETTKATMKKAWQMVLVKSAIIVGLPGRPGGTLLMPRPYLSLTGLTNTRNPLRRE
jgi:hypothetical protein